MSGLTFQKAVKNQEKLRLALDGPSGSGKTWTSLTIAEVLVGDTDGRVAVIDSERGSARKYATDFDFDHLELPDSNPHTYIAAMQAAVDARYAVIIVDSLSHAWEGTLELKDDVAKRSRSNNSFDAWREVTPVHNQLVDVMLRAPAHVIVTMRTKTAYVIEEYEDANGRTRTKPVKLGLKPIQRDGVEYEFDVVGDLDLENTLAISKTRCSSLAGAVIRKPGVPLARQLMEWLDDGEPAAQRVEIETLVDRMRALDDDTRPGCKREFMDSFGRPEQLRESQVLPALELVERWEAKQAGPSSSDAASEAEAGEGEQTVGTAGEPSPAPADDDEAPF